MQSKFVEMLKRFGNSVDLEGFEPSDTGACSLVFDGIIVNLELRKKTGLLFIYSTLGFLPDSGRESLYRSLLAANVFFEKTQGATLGIDENSDVVILQYQVPFLSLDDESFYLTIENFVNVADLWVTRLEKIAQEDVNDSAAESTTPDMPIVGIKI
ncbi:type III secretion system chaperone [Halodesulfovibrio marinisediminis]|uniref:Tir chaperone protein (CesT) family protein n=1 Tax=Halodesulfovibrio marinisediminis DSM 17456 TaxID=1121457 RepID=A0A1N6I9Y9_9BACT|nr:type III secretion system chaperone [Halodesulfovibrio marinisediminis]SIO28848.1 Tir chaperone protein (CesT) family protein [Halodesulfovibrio marinisediminis DSM 17456]